MPSGKSWQVFARAKNNLSEGLMIMGKMTNRFNMELPDDWEDRSVYTFMGPDDSGVQHILTLVVDPKVDVELHEFARDRIDAITETIQGIEILKDEPKTLENGNPVHEFVYRWIPTDGKVIFQKVIYMILDDGGYTFSCNFSKKTIKTLGIEMEQMINSFSPLPESD
jgi:hypothetical protein